MMPRVRSLGASLDEPNPFRRTRRRVTPWLVFLASLLGFALAYGSTKWRGLPSASASKEAMRKFIRVEDLPRAEGFLRIDDLPRLPPIALRPLQGAELTPELIRKADEMLRNHEKPLGTQVLLEARNKTYVARFEWHYTYDNDPDRPQSWHKGITLYATE
jgi:hypothetical protein